MGGVPGGNQGSSNALGRCCPYGAAVGGTPHCGGAQEESGHSWGINNHPKDLIRQKYPIVGVNNHPEDLLRQKYPNVGVNRSINGSMDGPQWTSMDLNGPQWTSMDQWMDLNGLMDGPQWTSVDLNGSMDGPQWTSVDLNGSMDGPQWTSMDLIR